jgi:hypothetical protein
MSTGLWIGVVVAILMGALGVPLALGMFRRRDR